MTSSKSSAVTGIPLCALRSTRKTTEFHNTVSNACSSNPLWHVNRVRQRPVWWNWRVLLPGFSDELAFDLGLIDFDGSLHALLDSLRPILAAAAKHNVFVNFEEPRKEVAQEIIPDLAFNQCL